MKVTILFFLSHERKVLPTYYLTFYSLSVKKKISNQSWEQYQFLWYMKQKERTIENAFSAM